MKRAKKGTFGYVRYEKKKRALITLIMFAIPLGVYFAGLYVNGTNKSVLTILAVLGILPAAKFAVDFIMILLVKDADPQIVALTEKNAKDLVHGYELTVTAYEGRMPLDAVVICGNEIACFSSHGEPSRFSFMEKHIAKIMNGNGFYNMNVKIFREKRAYEDRIRAFHEHPERFAFAATKKGKEEEKLLTYEERVFHTLMAISL